MAVIVAAAENGVIGKDNALPWRISADMRHFKSVTMGKPVIMGRKTFDSIGKPLPGRTNLVISRRAGYRAAGAIAARSLQEALSLAATQASSDKVSEVVVIGGAEIYRETIPLATRLYFTEVHAAVEGDAVMPAIDWSNWREVSRERHPSDSADGYAFSFVQYDRVY